MKKEFIKGQWYKGQSDNYYIKFDRIDVHNGYNRVYYTEKIYARIGNELEYFNVSDFWSNSDFEKFALENPVRLEEIQEFLPEGHTDKNNSYYEIY